MPSRAKRGKMSSALKGIWRVVKRSFNHTGVVLTACETENIQGQTNQKKRRNDEYADVGQELKSIS